MYGVFDVQQRNLGRQSLHMRRAHLDFGFAVPLRVKFGVMLLECIPPSQPPAADGDEINILRDDFSQRVHVVTIPGILPGGNDVD